MPGCDKKLRCCNSKFKNKSTESDDELYTPPGIGLCLAACHQSLSQQADDFHILVDSGSSTFFIDSELIREVATRMQQYTTIEPPMEIKAARDKILYGTAQGVQLVLVRGTDDVLREVELPVVLVPGLKKNIFPSTTAAAQKVVKILIAQSASHVYFKPFRVQTTRSSSIDHLDLTIAKNAYEQSMLFVQA